jgi:hypothetical protein
MSDGHPPSANPGVPRVHESSHRLFGITEIEGGFPHSEIPGSKPVRGSPGLIAAYHVLHRLSAPRHPPNALKTLDRSHRQGAIQKTEDGRRNTEDGRIRSLFSDVRSPTPDASWTFEKTSFASNASGSLSGQARLTTGLEPENRERKTENGLLRRPSSVVRVPVRPNAFPLHNVR